MRFCRHSRTTFPQTPKGGTTYVVCLGCGAEFEYDWTQMKQGKRIVNDMQRRSVTIKILSLATGGSSIYDGQYLVDYNPTPLESGEVLLAVCDDRAGAKKFSTVDEAMAVWEGVSQKGPMSDGKPDRPLTAYSVEIESCKEITKQ